MPIDSDRPLNTKTPTRPGLSARLISFWFRSNQTPNEWGQNGLGVGWVGALTALSWVYRLIWNLREIWHSVIAQPGRISRVRTIALGNLVIGGAGKTPCALALAQALTQEGIACGLISRGYGSKAEGRRSQVICPQELVNRNAGEIGDEAWLLCWRSQLPIAVGKNRFQSLAALLAARPEIRVAILDDGLQQRSLHCDETILIIDERGFGNEQCLPLGPLREPIGNLKRFSAWIANGNVTSTTPLPEMPIRHGVLHLRPSQWVCLESWQDSRTWLDLKTGLVRFAEQKILAVAGIAVPDRFFDSLRSLGLSFDALALPDHDPEIVGMTLSRWETGRYTTILMTEKDAVKFFHANIDLRHQFWALRQEPVLDNLFVKEIISSLPPSV